MAVEDLTKLIKKYMRIVMKQKHVDAIDSTQKLLTTVSQDEHTAKNVNS